MTARILIVDDVPANTRLLEARLSAEYYQVACARDGFEAVDRARDWQPDLILLDVMMPGMDGFECCRILKDDETTLHIPVVMVTALGESAERLRGLEAGADDFLTKPVEYDTLMARVRSLVRLKRLLDEWRVRGETARALGLAAPRPAVPSIQGARALVIDEWELNGDVILRALAREGIEATPVRSAEEVLARVSSQPFDLIVISLQLTEDDALQLVSALRAADATHETPLLLVADSSERERVLRGFELGASDWLSTPVDENELRARARNQIRRKFYQDRFRSDLSIALELALTDPLTSLYNQRYLRRHLSGLVQSGQGRPIALLMIDVDHFKSVNDRFGHASGDQALKMIAEVFRDNIRAFDSLARYGGEEFVVVMPGSNPDDAAAAAERLRLAVETIAFEPKAGQPHRLTISVGVACSNDETSSSDQLLSLADDALYRAKEFGRNRVELAPQGSPVHGPGVQKVA
jgi:two-component system, cell cycle response regulator